MKKPHQKIILMLGLGVIIQSCTHSDLSFKDDVLVIERVTDYGKDGRKPTGQYCYVFKKQDITYCTDTLYKPGDTLIFSRNTHSK